MNWTLAALMGVVVVTGLWKYRNDYRRYGRTTILGAFAIFAVFSVPNLSVGLFVPWIGIPATAVQAAGFLLIIAGFVVCLIPIIGFRSAKKVIGMEAGVLEVSGLYRYSRNPQYIGYGLFLLGWAMCGNSPKAFVGVALYWLVVHLTILIEEEHLSGVFGDAYKEYRDNTPRYLFH